MRQPIHMHVLSLAALALGVAACAGPDGAAQPAAVSGMTTTTAGTSSLIPSSPVSQTPAVPTATTAATARPEATLTDSEIVSIVDSAGLTVRQQARDALKRSQNDRVRQLAHLVLTDRSEGELKRVETMTTLVPVDNPASALFRSNGLQVAASLSSASDGDFDRAYVAALVSEERQLIALLGDKLIPQAQNLDLRGVLEALRTSTSSHLGMAADIQSSMTR